MGLEIVIVGVVVAKNLDARVIMVFNQRRGEMDNRMVSEIARQIADFEARSRVGSILRTGQGIGERHGQLFVPALVDRENRFRRQRWMVIVTEQQITESNARIRATLQCLLERGKGLIELALIKQGIAHTIQSLCARRRTLQCVLKQYGCLLQF